MENSIVNNGTHGKSHGNVLSTERKEFAAMIDEWQRSCKSHTKAEGLIPPVNSFRLLGTDFVARLERQDNIKYLPAVMKVIQKAGFSLPEESKCIEWSKQAHGWNTPDSVPFIELDDLLYYIQDPCDELHEFLDFVSACFSKSVLYHFHLIPNRYHVLCRAQDLCKGVVDDQKFNEILRLYKIEFGKDLRFNLVDPAFADCWDFEELTIESLCKEVEYALVDDNYSSIVAKDIIKKVQSDEENWGVLFKQVRYLLNKGFLK